MLSKIKYVLLILFIFGMYASILAEGTEDEKKNKRFNKVTVNDDYEWIVPNQALMWLSNNGDGSHDPTTNGPGLYWPGGLEANLSVIFEDGLIWGGVVQGEIRVGGSTYRHGLQAGKILAPNDPDDAEKDKYRIYRIKKNWSSVDPTLDNNSNGVPDREEFKEDWMEWPVEDGAPWIDVDDDGIYSPDPNNPLEADRPDIMGDEMVWFVSNDLAPSRTNRLYGSPPMGIEVQVSAFGFNRVGDLGNIIFKRYLMINKGNNTIDSMYIAQWSDPDVGNASDDFAGCDTALSLGYAYNGTNNDDTYGSPPPAAGYDFFQGPIVESNNPNDSAKFKGEWRDGYKNLPMTTYTFFINPVENYADPDLGIYEGTRQMYNYMTGKTRDGGDFVDPNTGEAVDYVLAGDPVEGTGWYQGDGWPGSGPGLQDIRLVLSSGPFTMEPQDTQEVVVGIVLSQGSDNINSVKALKRTDGTAQFAYNNDFELPAAPPSPEVTDVSGDQEIDIYWSDEAAEYENEFYEFEGYRVWQYRDKKGSDPELLGVFDKVNDIDNIFDTLLVQGVKTLDLTIKAPNTGLRHSMKITKDPYSNGPLYNARPYYFAVTPFAHLKDSADYDKFGSFVLETPAKIIEVKPGRNAIDESYQVNAGEQTMAEHVEGYGNGNVTIDVVDPIAFENSSYSTVFDTITVGGTDNLSFSLLKNGTDTLINNSTQISQPFSDAIVYDGMKFQVNNTGQDSLDAEGDHKYRVKDVVQVKGEGGQTISDPKNVWYDQDTVDNFSVDGNWTVKALGGTNFDSFIWQGTQGDEGLGYTNYEIRFTGTSEYYLMNKGFRLNATDDDQKGQGTLPFEVWDIGQDVDSPDDDQRLICKVLDEALTPSDQKYVNNDGQYSQLDNGNWEQIYVYSDPDRDPANLPDQSGESEKTDHRFGGFTISGEIPAQGTVIRMTTYKMLTDDDKFTFVAKSPDRNDLAKAEQNKDEISVFPNPYLGANQLERDKYNRFVRFTGLPNKCTIRIFSLSGVFIKKYVKDNTSQYLDWNLKNNDELPVSSGVYIAYIEIPGAGTKTMKIAVIREQQYIDRL